MIEDQIGSTTNPRAHDPLVTVVVVNRDRRELLRACLRSRPARLGATPAHKN